MLWLVGLRQAVAQFSFASAVNYTVGSYPVSVTTADVNRDGKLDLICACFSTNQVWIMTGNGNGGLSLSSKVNVGNGPTCVTSADLNGDGNVDIITANLWDNTLSVLRNNGSGFFTLNSTLAVGSHPRSVVAADVNGDGKMDLICANNGSSTLSVLTNDGSGGFVLSSSPSVGLVTVHRVNRNVREEWVSVSEEGIRKNPTTEKEWGAH